MKTAIRSAVIILIFISLTGATILPGGCGEPETENTFLKLLRLIPEDIKLSGIVEIKDYEKWRELNQIDIYKTDNERCNVEEYVERLADAMDDGEFLAEHIFQNEDFYTGFNRYMRTTTISDEYIGYDFVDVDAQVTVLTYGADMMLAAIGNFSEKSTNDALSAQKGWKPLTKEKYSTENYSGLTIHSWGDGTDINIDITLSPPHADIGGRLLPLAVDDGFLFMSHSVDNVKKMIDAGTGKTASLLDMEGYVQAAEAMNDAGAYYVMFISPEHMESENDDAEKSPGDTLVIGFGGGADEKEVEISMGCRRLLSSFACSRLDRGGRGAEGHRYSSSTRGHGHGAIGYFSL